MVNVWLGHDLGYKLDGFVMIRGDPKNRNIAKKILVLNVSEFVFLTFGSELSCNLCNFDLG